MSDKYVFQHPFGKWGFYDETWQEFHKLYLTKELAEEALKAYVEWLDTGKDSEILR